MFRRLIQRLGNFFGRMRADRRSLERLAVSQFERDMEALRISGL